MGIRAQVFGALQKLWDAGPGPTGRRRARAMGGVLGPARLIGSMGKISTGPDSFIRGGLKDWRANARWLSTTNPYAKQAAAAFKTNLIGHKGIRMRANVHIEDTRAARRARAAFGKVLAAHDGSRKSAGVVLAKLDELRKREKDEDRCQSLETEWTKFCRADSFDRAGQLSFHGFQLQIVGSFPGAGGCMVRAVPEAAGKSKVPISFELIPMDRLDDDKRGPSDTAGRHWRDGIEHDIRTGRRTGYAILTDHPSEHDAPRWILGGRKWVYVPADQIAHIFIPDEIGQTREVPWLLPVLTTIHSMGEYENSHWTRKRVINNTLGFLEEEESEFPNTDVVSDDDDADDVSSIDLLNQSSPGQWIKLRGGEKVVQPQFGPDDGAFEVVLKTMLRRFCAGLSISYATVSRDYGEANYSSLRQSALDDRDHWRVGQALIAEQFCQWAYEKWLDAAVFAGVLPSTLFADYWVNPDRYLCPVWQPRSWQWVDPLKEIKGLELAKQNHLQTLAEQIAETSGEDLESLLIQRSYEQQLITALGLDPVPQFGGGKDVESESPDIP
jgi:lambda family phage portal protein